MTSSTRRSRCRELWYAPVPPELASSIGAPSSPPLDVQSTTSGAARLCVGGALYETPSAPAMQRALSCPEWRTEVSVVPVDPVVRLLLQLSMCGDPMMNGKSAKSARLYRATCGPRRDDRRQKLLIILSSSRAPEVVLL